VRQLLSIPSNWIIILQVGKSPSAHVFGCDLCVHRTWLQLLSIPSNWIIILQVCACAACHPACVCGACTCFPG
jgi:hypothetical protein